MFGEKLRVLKIDEPDDGYGKFTYLEGYKYPYHGYPDERIVNADAIFKRAIMENIKLIVRKPFRYLIPFMLLLPKRQVYKRLIVWLGSLSEVAFINTRYILPEKRFCRFCREMLRAGKEVIRDFPDRKHEYPEKALLGFVMFLEFDNAYRYPSQNVLSKLNKDNLMKNPRKEILRLVEIGLKWERASISEADKKSDKEVFDMGDKWRMILWVLRIGLLISPQLLCFIKKFMLELNIEEVKFDEADWYWVCERYDFDYDGISYDVRKAQRLAIDEEYRKTILPSQAEQPYCMIIPNQEFFKMEKTEAEKLVRNLEKQLWDDWDCKSKDLDLKPL